MAGWLIDSQFRQVVRSISGDCMPIATVSTFSSLYHFNFVSVYIAANLAGSEYVLLCGSVTLTFSVLSVSFRIHIIFACFVFVQALIIYFFFSRASPKRISECKQTK